MKNGNGIRRLIEHARRGRQAPREEAPLGFATRVVSRAFSAEREDPLVLWERMTRWSLALALVACLATVALHHRQPVSSALADFAGFNESADTLW